MCPVHIHIRIYVHIHNTLLYMGTYIENEHINITVYNSIYNIFIQYIYIYIQMIYRVTRYIII